MPEPSVPKDPVVEQTQRHIAELMEIVETCRDDERKLQGGHPANRAEAGDIAIAVAHINQTRVAALVAIHEAKMAFFQYQQAMSQAEMYSRMQGLVVPA